MKNKIQVFQIAVILFCLITLLSGCSKDVNKTEENDYSVKAGSILHVDTKVYKLFSELFYFSP